MTHWTIERDEELEAREASFQQWIDEQDALIYDTGPVRPGTEWDDQIVPVRPGIKTRGGKQSKREKRMARLMQHVPNLTRFGLAMPPEHLYDERLHGILSLARGHESKGEAMFIQQFLEPYSPTYVDEAAFVIQVERTDGTVPPFLFSCHIDTVHRGEGGNQTIWYDPQTESYFKKDDQALGADDGAGVWLMLEMIDAGVPGNYFFHRGEERGGIGSTWLAQHRPDLLRKMNFAVAFDRRGFTDVITHQGGVRGCSDAFAQALADQLNGDDLAMCYMPDDSGLYTDTREYFDLIPECTNVSCGYKSEHGGYEELNLPHLFAMRRALIAVDWPSLPIEREPGDLDLYDALGDGLALDLTRLTRDQMLELVYDQPELFVDLVRDELGLSRSWR